MGYRRRFVAVALGRSGDQSLAAVHPPPRASMSATLACRRVDSTVRALSSLDRRVVWAVMTIYLFSALRLTHYADYMQVFDVGRVQALARFYLSARFDLYYVALLFYGLASSVSGYLWFKSRYIPRGLAAFGMVSSAFCVVCTLAFLVAPGFDNIVGLWLFDTPMGIFDIVTSFWLLFRGLPRRASEN